MDGLCVTQGVLGIIDAYRWETIIRLPNKSSLILPSN
jgi:hypothetical protein